MTRQPEPAWELLILSEQPAATVWADIFARLGEIAMAAASPAALQRGTIVPDQLLAESAWDLWQRFVSDAPSVIDAIQNYWFAPSASAGTAVLILDGLSLRELPLFLAAGNKHGIQPARVQVRGAPVPTETDQFAAALGLAGRAKLFNNQPPQSFIFAGPDVHADLLDAPFADCVSIVPAKPRLFLWHKWPDFPLIHKLAEARNGETAVAAEIRKTIEGDGFWSFIDHLRQGRRLLITGDHGYAASASFSGEFSDPEIIRLFAGTFGAQRAVREDPANPWPRRQLPPPVLRFRDPVAPDKPPWLVVIGQRKWKVSGGFPALCHGGLSLLEAAVPVIELEEKR